MVFKITVLISGNGTNLQEIIDRINQGVLGHDIRINHVISNRKKAYGLIRAQEAKIKSSYFCFQKEKQDRDSYEQELFKLITDDKPELIVLAGWMHVLGLKFLNNIGIPIINLHPALPGQFPGVNAIKQAWDAYNRGEMNQPITGCMVHFVIPEIDAGEVITSTQVRILPDDTLDSLTQRIQYTEKSTLISAIIEVIDRIKNKPQNDEVSDEDQLTPDLIEKFSIASGKVRDIWKIKHGLLAMVHSDRFSSFDRHICQIDRKGLHLNQISSWWFNKTKCMIPNHLVYSQNNMMIVKECEVIPIEVVVRGYITGSTSTSLWVNYSKTEPDSEGNRSYCGIKFPDGLIKNQILDHPVVTPTTKDKEHDLPISAKEIIKRRICTLEEWDYIHRKALELFDYAANQVAKMGLILVDTKMEFGRDRKGKITLIDEIFTPDSSRFWVAESYTERFEAGIAPERLDKDLIREYLVENCDPYDTSEPLPEIPSELKDRVARAYSGFYHMLYNHDKTPKYSNKPKSNKPKSYRVVGNGKIKDVEGVINNYFFRFHSPICVIFTDSHQMTNLNLANQIKNELNILNIYSMIQVYSPFSQTSQLLCALEDYCDDVDNGRKIIFCVVSRNPSALARIISCNTAVPVITCPILNEKEDISEFTQITEGAISVVFHPKSCAQFIVKIFNLGKYRRRYIY